MKFTIRIALILFTMIPCALLAQDSVEVVTFKSIEEALIHPEKVIRLDLSNQEIDFSKGFLKKFKNLQYLSLKDDHLEQFPIGILELENLRILDLSGNDFFELPENIFKLKNLEELYLNDEKNLNLNKTLNQLGDLPKLKSLHLENDHIKEIPESIVKLKKLEKLYLNNNELKQLPSTIEQMNQLKYLDIHQNLIPPNIQMNHNPNGNMIIKF